MSFGIGDTVGTYKIVSAIGAGGMGEVFRVEHVVTNRVEAMKILAAATSTSPEQDQRMLDLLEQTPTYQKREAQKRLGERRLRPTMEDK